MLDNADAVSAAIVRRRFTALLGAMARWAPAAGALAGAIAHFRGVTRRYWRGLFHTYDIAGLPRTNNNLEHLFGTTRYRERRATGRKGASPALVLRGSVCVLAIVGTPGTGLTADTLAPRDLTAWRALRARLEQRHESRRAQLRFRRDPARYLAALEQQYLQPALPS